MSDATKLAQRITPGHWTHKRRALLIPPKTSYICEVGHDWHVVSDIPRDSWNHSEHDAELIALAPTLLAQRDALLAALQVMVDHACERYPHFESERGQRDIEQARAAIALAGGSL